MTKLKTMAVLAALFGWLGVGTAKAANPAYLNIDVAILANLSVAVNGAASSTHTVTWNTATPNAHLVSAASATVTNDSGGQTEKFALSTNGNSINTLGNADVWTLDTTTATLPGADQVAVQAVFGSSNTAAAGCPIAASSDWDQSFAPPLTTSPVTYTSAVFADTSLSAGGGTPNPDVTAGGANGRMFAGSFRALCWRVITPQSTATVDTQNVQVIVTAQNP
jgi:hypothetical protein